MSDAEMAIESGKGGLIEDLGHQTEVLEDRDGFTVGSSDPGRFLAAMLKGEQAEIDEIRNRLCRRIRGKDPAGLTGAIWVWK